MVMASSLVRAEELSESEYKAFVICKSKKRVRTIRVIMESAGCSTLYSKEGVEKSVGGGKNLDSCLNFLNNVKTNLEKSNWTCRDAGATKRTTASK